MFLDTSLILFPVFTSLWLSTRPAYSHSLAMTPRCDRGPGYTTTTLSKFLLFCNALTNIPPWTSAPSLSFTVDGKLYNTTMDTGSIGLLLSAADMVDYDPESAAKYPIGWQFFTSSFILQTGNWIPKKISFVEANVTATVPVLAVTTSVVCPWYNIQPTQVLAQCWRMEPKQQQPVCQPEYRTWGLDSDESTTVSPRARPTSYRS
jgi:hypothetical protein